MTTASREHGRKWINAFLAIACAVLGFVVIRFTQQLGEWFDLEAKIKNFLLVSQALGVAVGLGSFVVASKRKDLMDYLNEVYGELVKVIWPDGDSVTKLTIGIVIGLSIVSTILVSIDFIVRKILELIY